MIAKNGVLKGNRVFLRSLCQEDDISDYHQWLHDPAVIRYLEVRFTQRDEASIREFIHTTNESTDSLLLGIFREDNQRHIGNVKLGPINRNHNYAELGLLVGDRSSWGLGFATESIQLVTEYGFDTLSLHKVVAGCYEVNVGSVKAFTKAGYIIEGKRTSQYLAEGKYVGQILLGKVNPEKS